MPPTCYRVAQRFCHLLTIARKEQQAVNYITYLLVDEDGGDDDQNGDHGWNCDAQKEHLARALPARVGGLCRVAPRTVREPRPDCIDTEL